MEPFENHLILGKSSWNTRQMSNCLHPGALIIINSNDSYLAFFFFLRVYYMSQTGLSTAPAGWDTCDILSAWNPRISSENRTPGFQGELSPSYPGMVQREHQSGCLTHSIGQEGSTWQTWGQSDSILKESKPWADRHIDRGWVESSQETIPGVLMLTQPELSWFFSFLKPSFALISRIFAIDSLLSHAHWMVERKLKPRSPHSALALNHYDNLVTWQMLNCGAVFWGVVSRSGLEARLSSKPASATRCSWQVT